MWQQQQEQTTWREPCEVRWCLDTMSLSMEQPRPMIVAMVMAVDMKVVSLVTQAVERHTAPTAVVDSEEPRCRSMMLTMALLLLLLPHVAPTDSLQQPSFR